MEVGRIQAHRTLFQNDVVHIVAATHGIGDAEGDIMAVIGIVLEGDLLQTVGVGVVGREVDGVHHHEGGGISLVTHHTHFKVSAAAATAGVEADHQVADVDALIQCRQDGDVEASVGVVEIQEARAAVGIGVARDIDIVGGVGGVAVPAEDVVVLTGAVNLAGILEILGERKLGYAGAFRAEADDIAPDTRLRAAAQRTHTNLVLRVALQA